MCRKTQNDLRRIRSVADYQFGKGVGDVLFPEGVTISYSKNTGRIRYIHFDGERMATMRPVDGLFSLSIAGGKRIVDNAKSARCLVRVRNDVAKFIADGSDVFAAHVVKVDEDVRAKDEVIVVSKNLQVLAVGKASLCAREMRAFKRGVAVKVRRGCSERS